MTAFADSSTKLCTKCLIEKSLAMFSMKRPEKNQHYSQCKDCINEAGRERWLRTKDVRKLQIREWQKANPEKVNVAKRARRAKARENAPKKIPFDKGEWLRNNKSRLAGYRRKYLRENRVLAMSDRIRRRINGVLSRFGFVKQFRAVEVVGCSWPDLCAHLEKQFAPGMTWENRGEWEIDHIMPLATATCEADIIRLNHYSNLQPLWRHDNRTKSAKVGVL